MALLDEEIETCCSYCGESGDADALQTLDGEDYCQSCFDEVTFMCEDCSDATHDDDANHVKTLGGRYGDTEVAQVVCNDCFNLNYTRCMDCGENWHDHHITIVRSGSRVCYSCIGENYSTCGSCGDMCHNDGLTYSSSREGYYCSSCKNDKANVIHGYSYKPRAIFHGEGPRFYGIELEVEGGGTNESEVLPVHRVINPDRDDSVAYFKDDGSLDDGFEIVTHPCSFDYHMNEIDWKAVLRELNTQGYDNNASNAGYHIHISKDAFGQTEEQQEHRIGRLLYLFEKFYNHILKLSRRTRADMGEWAERYGVDVVAKQHKNTYKNAKDDGSRYRIVNLSNTHTVEIRAWKGTTNYQTFIGTLQFVETLMNIVMSIAPVQFITWENIKNTAKNSGFQAFTQYCNERNV